MSVTLTPPRWGTPRDLSVDTHGPAAAEVARRLGFDAGLFAWQQYVFDVALEVEAGGGYRYKSVGVEVGRQNGKTAGVVVRIMLELEQPNRHVAFTAQDRNMAREKWEEHVELIMGSDYAAEVRAVVRSNGREHLIMNNGSTYSIFTPSKKGPRGKTLDLVVIDEALTHSLEVAAAVLPTMLTRKDAQFWILSNAGTADSEMLKHFRDIGHKGEPTADRLAWFEWAPAVDRFDIEDETVWYDAIPSLAEEHGVTIEGVRALKSVMTDDDFAREVLNVWPSTSAIAVIDPEAWAKLENPDVIIPPVGMSFGIDVSPDREQSAIAAAGKTGAITVVELVELRERTGWLIDRCRELHRNHRSCQFVVDAGAAAGSLIPDLVDAGLSVVEVNGREYARACGLFYDLVDGDRLAHRAQWQLDDAVAGASKRKLGDAWAWNRRGELPITPIVAATLAVYGNATSATKGTGKIY